MKGLRISLVLMTAALMVIGLTSVASAFHSGGVAECEGCHSMHNSFEGSAIEVNGVPMAQNGVYLLKGSSQSSACLNCHNAADTSMSASGNGYHISTANVNPYDTTVPWEMTPGGDFAWLKKTMTGSLRKAATTWEGDRHGHNIIATDFGYAADKILTVAPGGSYPAANLACTSCHDPHGKYRRLADGTQAATGLPIFGSGSYQSSINPTAGVSAVGVYRLLAGVGYQPKSVSGSYPFVNPAPDAVASSSYNKFELQNYGATTPTSSTGTAQTVVAYGQGMSEWCANCHTAMHRDITSVGTTPGLVHPAGNGAKLSNEVAVNYNAYVRTGDMTGGAPAGFSTLAPFEIGSADYITILKPFVSNPTSATVSNNVNCLSCHRSHASAFESMARYSLGNEFMTVADGSNAAIYDTSTTENKVNFGYNTQQQINAYNGRPATVFGPWARNYCNKCHAKD